MGETTAYFLLTEDAERFRAVYEAFVDDPGCEHADAGVVFGDDGLTPLPHSPHDATCPHCAAENFTEYKAALQDAVAFPDDLTLHCTSCNQDYGLAQVGIRTTNWCVARNYLFVADIDPDEWEDEGLIERCRTLLPGVVDIILGWDT